MTATSTTVASPTAAPVTAPPAPSPGTITYTVKPGDNLSSIAWWFKIHGYESLYAANQAVIGANPNLIFAGERITITNGVMTMQPPA